MPGVRDALRSGPVTASQPRFNKIEVGPNRLRIETVCAEENPGVRATRP
jgi:hypothetical protein